MLLYVPLSPPVWDGSAQEAMAVPFAWCLC